MGYTDTLKHSAEHELQHEVFANACREVSASFADIFADVPAAATFLTKVALDIIRPFFRPDFIHFMGTIRELNYS